MGFRNHAQYDHRPNFQELRRHRELLRRQRAEAEEVAGALVLYLQ